MSERGSFVTEYICCEKCLEVAKLVLSEQHKYFCAHQIMGWGSNPRPLPIIAGKIGGLYSGEEIHAFESEFVPVLAEKICHPIRVAVLAEWGEKIFTIAPCNQVEDRK